MITRPALCPAGSTFWIKTSKSQLPINRISSYFFALHPLALLKAIECSTAPSGKTNISKLNFTSGRTGRMAGPAASSTLVKLSLKKGRFHISITRVGVGIHNFIPIAQISLRYCLQRAALLSMYFLSVIAVHITLVIQYSQRFPLGTVFNESDNTNQWECSVQVKVHGQRQ